MASYHGASDDIVAATLNYFSSRDLCRVALARQTFPDSAPGKKGPVKDVFEEITAGAGALHSVRLVSLLKRADDVETNNSLRAAEDQGRRIRPRLVKLH